ncbi:olfactory receptor 2A12-like [Leptodactylus fuscus]
MKWGKEDPRRKRKTGQNDEEHGKEGKERGIKRREENVKTVFGRTDQGGCPCQHLGERSTDLLWMTLATEVILLGFSKNFKINLALFFLFLAIYLVTLFDNGFMVFAIILSSHLHTPMYFFLCNLAFLDFFYSSSTVLKLLVDLWSSSGRTSLTACGIQVYVGLFLGNTESLLLVLMAYDRYVAICRPLYYPVHMRWSVCHRLIAVVWIYSFMTTVVPSLLMPMRACNPNQINHFACEVLAVIKLSCDSTHSNDVVILFLSFFSLLLPFVFIILSYSFIISSVLKIQSAGRSKAFSTCSSHLTVVVLFYGTAMVMYLGPSSHYLPNQAKYTSVFYVVGICQYPLVKSRVEKYLACPNFSKNLSTLGIRMVYGHIGNSLLAPGYWSSPFTTFTEHRKLQHLGNSILTFSITS